MKSKTRFMVVLDCHLKNDDDSAWFESLEASGWTMIEITDMGYLFKTDI